MARSRRPNWRGIKIHRNYEVGEAARDLRVCKGTVRRWIKSGLPTLTDRKPMLILGEDLIAFHKARTGKRQTCQPNECYCVKCRMTYVKLSIGELEKDDVASIQTGPFGTQLKASDYRSEGIPVINVRNIGFGGLRTDKLEYVPEETAERLSVHVLAERDIVFGRKGAVDRHLFVSKGQEGWVQGSDCIRLRLDQKRINSRFVSYAFLRSQHKEWMLQQCGNKATMASLNQDVIRRIVLSIPRLDQQAEIVSILSAYDNLIENNRRRIALLEEAARMLYREWFVHFRFAAHLKYKLGWESVYAWNDETFGPGGTLGRKDTTEAVLSRDLRAALQRLNPDLPAAAIDDTLRALTVHDFSHSMVQHNQDFARLIRNGVPVSWRDATGQRRDARARVIDFDNKPGSNRFLAVRELKLTGLRTPNYNRRADLVCFVNGLPLVFIELKAVYKNIRAGFDGNLRDYMDENVVAHAFHHNAFLIVSNGHRARYGSITSEWDHFTEWKRQDEGDKGDVEAEVLLNGMLAHERLLDIVENFILFDESKAGKTRKVVARNNQVLGVNRAVASVVYQESLKREFPPDARLRHRVIELPLERRARADQERIAGAAQEREPALPSFIPEGPVNIIERAHLDLGRLGVFWHTQGSGKSYSMAFFAEKVRRKVEGNFTFLLMTDRNDLDSQIYKTFVGCDVVDKDTPRAASGADLEKLLKENHRYIFSLIHKFNQDVDPKKPYSERDDIIVISDEAHRTQAGRLARNMRLALPNAAFIGFTGTPLFKQDEITKRIFGDYVSRYDFKRSEEDGATVKLVYENRGEKLGVARTDLNDRIATKIEEAELDPDQAALLDRLLGQDYEVITADERLDKIAADFVEHCATRWEAGKSLFVCIDKITCARMHQRIMPRWRTKAVEVRAALEARKAEVATTADETARAALIDEIGKLEKKAKWLDETIIEIIISEAQNEVADFKKWGFDIIPHRALMKKGFEAEDGERVDVETAFKNPKHRFRVAIVCAMWLTGFDVECLSTLYIDKPMKAQRDAGAQPKR